MARGYGTLPAFAQGDGTDLSPFMRQFLAGIGADPSDAPQATPPGFTGYTPTTPPTGPATSVLDVAGVGAIGQRAADVGAGLADMGSRTADLFGRLRSGDIDAGSFLKAAASHIAGQAYDAGKTAVTAPRDSWTGDLPIFGPDGHPTDEAMDRASGLAGLAMTGSVPFKAPAGALRSFGGAAAHDDIGAALEAALGHVEPIAPPAGPTRVDPTAKSWDLYHGSPGGPDFARFDPSMSSNPAERGAVFFSPSAETASGYTATGAVPTGPTEAGARVFRTTVEPGKTGVFDLAHLAENDPAFNARAREITTRDSGPAHGRSFDSYMDGFRSNRVQDQDIAQQASALGYDLGPDAGTRLSFGYGHIGAAIERAKAQGLDTAVLRGLAEHGGDDQVVALTPGRVRSAYAPDQLLYSGGPAGAAGLPALAASGTPANAPSPTTKGPSMSSGLAPFGSLPQFAGFSADDFAQLLQRIQAQQGQQPPAPGAQDPQTTGALGQPQPDAPPASLPPDLARLLSGVPMGGGPNGFSGTSGQVMPPTGPNVPANSIPQLPGSQDASALSAPSPLRRFGQLPGLGDDPGPVPLPPGRPADLSMPDPATTGGVPQRQIVASSTYHPDAPGMGPRDANGMPPGGRPPADAPADGPRPSPLAPGGAARPGAVAPAPVDSFDPLTGQVTSGSPQPVGAPQGAAQPSMMDKFKKAILGGMDPDTSSLLLNVGAGLMGTRGFGSGVAAGLKGYQEQAQKSATNDLLRAKFGIDVAKYQQQLAGQNQTIGVLVRAGHSPESAAAIVASAAGGNATALNNALANAVPKSPDAPSGYRPAADGGLDIIPRGPADPKKIEEDAKARAPDKTQTPLTDPAARLAAGVPAYDSRPAWKDADGKVTFNEGPAPKITTTRNPDGSSTARVWDPATQSFREAPGGGTTGPGAVDVAGQKEGMGLALKSLETSVGSIHSGTFPQLKSLDRLEQNLKTGIYTGAGADRATKIAGFLDQLGIGDHGKLANTQEFLNSAAQDYARLAKSTFPQRVTNADLGVAKIMAGTNQDQTETALQNAIEMQRENAHMSIAQHNARVDKFAKAFPGQQNLADFYRVDPGEYGMGQNPPQGPTQQQAPTSTGAGPQAGPSPAGGAAFRYQQLRRSGLSQADAHARMSQEGF